MIETLEGTCLGSFRRRVRSGRLGGRFACLLYIAAATFLVPFPGECQTTSLAFRPVDAQYSVALDRAILVSGNPNLLHVYDLDSNSDQTVALRDTPLNVSVSPDGLHAAVAHNASISYVNLQSLAIEKSFSFAVGTGTLVLSSEYVYVMPHYDGSPTSISLATGQAITASTTYYGTGGRLDPAVNAIYVSWDSTYPSLLARYSVTGDTLSNQVQDVDFETYRLCGDNWFSSDGTRIYNGCGNVFHASSNPNTDMTFLGPIPGLTNIQSLAISNAIQRIAAIPEVVPYVISPDSDDEIRLYEDNHFNPVGRFVLPSFTVNGNTYVGHGRWVFFNNAGSALYSFVEADTTSGLVNDFVLHKIAIANPISCAATFASSSASAPGSGTPESVGISAGTECTYTAISNVPWIQLAAGYFGSGNNTLSYVVRRNPSSQPRSGTISLGGQTFTVNQGAAPQGGPSENLSVPVVVADYSKGLNKLVFVASAPNELHVYDPVSQVDQVVSLPAVPISVSVRPDGLYAAVGHAGWISYVNLQGLAVENIFPITGIVSQIVLAGNGYIYGLLAPPRMVSLQISNGDVSSLIDDSGGTFPRLHPSDKYLYVSGHFAAKWNIQNGPAALLFWDPAPLGLRKHMAERRWRPDLYGVRNTLSCFRGFERRFHGRWESIRKQRGDYLGCRFRPATTNRGADARGARG